MRAEWVEISGSCRTTDREATIAEIEKGWESDRWRDTTRPYTAEDVFRLRGSIRVEHSIANETARKLWHLLASEPYVPALGATTGHQAVQMVRAGLRAIYVSGWQVAADTNLAGETYPDLSLYPSNSVPHHVRRINKALQRADQIEHAEARKSIDWLVPILADAEAGFGGPLNVFELAKSIIEAGGAGIHFEDQLAAEKKCGHLGGKVLVPTGHFIRTLIAARLAADVMGVSTVLVARTDANASQLITSDIDQRDKQFLTGERTPEGFFAFRGGLEAAIARGRSYAPYADMVWCETATPNLEEARRFAEGIHSAYPGKYLAYNCSPSFNWEKHLDPEKIRGFQRQLADFGYKFQFITLAGFHSLNHSMFELATSYSKEGMPAYVRLQKREFEAEAHGYNAVRHQAFVGTNYFDEVARVISGGMSSTTAMKDSTEAAQFEKKIATIVKQTPAEMDRHTA